MLAFYRLASPKHGTIWSVFYSKIVAVEVGGQEMAIHYITIKGRIKNGKLEDIQLPPNTPDGEVEVQISTLEENVDTEPSIEDFKFESIPSDQIVVGGWEDLEIKDSVEWVKEMRRKQREERNDG
jgi:hypothetical protein